VLQAHLRNGMPARPVLRTIKPQLVIRQSTGPAVR